MANDQTLVGHIVELRQRLLISLGTVLLVACGTFYFSADILRWMQAPAAGLIDHLVFFSPTEAFSAHLRIALFSGLIFSSPVVLLQAWLFIVPALDVKHWRHGAWFIGLTLLAFVTGIMFGYFLLFPAAIKFLLGFSQGTLQPLISVSEYISFMAVLLLGCGLVFEMPVLSYLLARIGFLDHRVLRQNWRMAVIVILIVAAVVTPTPDPFNMCILALPMFALYELSIWVAKWGQPKKVVHTV